MEGTNQIQLIINERAKNKAIAEVKKLTDAFHQNNDIMKEHCAKAMDEDEAFDKSDVHSSPTPIWSGNFKGFIQYRKTFNNENITN